VKNNYHNRNYRDRRQYLLATVLLYCCVNNNNNYKEYKILIMHSHRRTYIDSITDSGFLSIIIIIIIIIYGTHCKFTDIIVYYRKRIVLCVCVHIIYIFMAVLVIYFSTGHYIIIKRVLLSSVVGCVCACPYKYYIYVRYGGGCQSVMIML